MKKTTTNLSSYTRLSALHLNLETSEYEVEVKTCGVSRYSDGLEGRGLTAGRGNKFFSSSYNQDWLWSSSIHLFSGAIAVFTQFTVHR
jgi:hypothetical protein